jgi:hypothetical protein
MMRNPSVNAGVPQATLCIRYERVNLVMDAACGIAVLTPLEAFVQCRLHPRFEGFDSQRQNDA